MRLASQPLGRPAALALMSVYSNRKEVETFGIRLPGHVAATAAELGHPAAAPPGAPEPRIRPGAAGGAAPGLALG